MSVRHLFAAPVPVLARSDRQGPEPAVEVPEVGLRWGQPSEFEFGLPGAPTSDLPPAVIIQRGEPRIFRGTESYREWGEETPAAGFAVESIKRTAFFLGERTEVYEQRKLEGNVTTVEPIVEAIREYVEFDFAFAVVGDRGELPPRPTQEAPPPPPSPKIVDVSDLGPFRTIVRYDSVAMFFISYSYFEPIEGFNFVSTFLRDPDDPDAPSVNPPIQKQIDEWPENAVAEREANGLILIEILESTKQNDGPVNYTRFGVPYVGERWTMTVTFLYIMDDWGEDERTRRSFEFVSPAGDGSDWQSILSADQRQKPDFRLDDGPSPVSSS